MNFGQIGNILSNVWAEFLGSFSTNLVSALLILVLGTLLAFIISNIVKAILHKTNIDNKIASWLSSSEDAVSFPIEKIISSIVFYFIMFIVVIRFLGTFDPAIANGPLETLLAQASEFVPKIIKSVLLTLLAVVVAFVAKAGLQKVFSALKFEERVLKISNKEEQESSSIIPSLVNTVFWVIILFFLPSILEPLGLTSLLEPLMNIGGELLSYSNNIIGAIILFAVGLLIAKIIQQILSGLLESSGINGLADKLGLSKLLGDSTLSKILSSVVYFFVIFTATVQALDVLAIDAISVPAKEILYSIFNIIKAIIGAGLGIAVAYFIGNIIAKWVANLLQNIGFNNLFEFLGLPKTEEIESKKTPSQIAGYVVLATILLFTSTVVAEKLGFIVLAEKLDLFILFMSQVLLGLIIFAIGLLLSNFVAKVILSSSLKQAKVLSLFAQVAILFITGAMSLTQIGVGKDIVDLAFGILLGAAAISVAIAVGLGCKDIAAREVENVLKSVRDSD